MHDGDVVFSWSGSLMVELWCGGKCGLNQHLFKVTSSNYDRWFYYLWTKYHLNKFIALASAMATTMGHIKRSELNNSVVFIPSESDYDQLNRIFKPIYDLIVTNRTEINSLVSIRDILIEKMISGKIDVSNVNL